MRTMMAWTLAMAFAWALPARATPVCAGCEEGPPSDVFEDADFAAAKIDIWRCPACGDYYWGGGWHGPFDFEAEKKRLALRAEGIPDKCPACGGPLDETYAYVIATDEATKPSYICYNCWTVVFPDGTAMSSDDIKAFEAERKVASDQKRVAALAADFGWTKEKATRVVAGQVAVGDEPAAVREAWGPPSRTERTFQPKVDEETWYYADGRTVAFKDGAVKALSE